MEEYSRSTTHKSIQGSILILMNFFAICGNIFVCLAVYRKRKSLTVPYLYVLALAISDLMVAILCFPFCVQAFLEDGWIHGHYMCQFNGFLVYYWGGISVPTLALTAVNRYFRVVKTQIYRNYFTIKSSLAMISAVWVLTLFDGFLSTFVGPVIYKYDPRFFFCAGTFTSKKHEKAIGVSLHLIHVFIPLIIIVFCYVNVFRSVRRHNANVMPSLHAEQCQQLAVNAWEMRVTKLLFFVVLGFFLCWIPVIIIGILSHSSTVKLPNFAYELYTFLAFASTVINPFIYGVANREFRRELLGIFRCS
ncbi:melatonin receptor type 1B-B-like [Oculina patagonica]